MPPGPVYNWLCVLHSAAEILGHAARYRAAQFPLQHTDPFFAPRKRKRTDESATEEAPLQRSNIAGFTGEIAGQQVVQNRETPPEDVPPVAQVVSAQPVIQNDVQDVRPVQVSFSYSITFSYFTLCFLIQESTVHFLQPIATPQASRNLKPSKVPSSRIGRLFHYGGRFPFFSHQSRTSFQIDGQCFQGWQRL